MNTRLYVCLIPLLFGSAASAVSTNAVPAVLGIAQTTQKPSSNSIPLSVFTIPHDPKEGRDPFFPNSARLATSNAGTNSAAASMANSIAFLLQGISGTSDRRLAIINGRTFAAGEEGEITVGARRVNVRCVEIRADSVVIETGGSSRELHLRSAN